MNVVQGGEIERDLEQLAESLRASTVAVRLRGDGGAFCSGLDVDAFAAAPAWREQWQTDYAGFHRDLYRCPAVIVGAVTWLLVTARNDLAPPG